MENKMTFFQKYIIFITVVIMSVAAFLAYDHWNNDKENFEYFVEEIAFHYQCPATDSDGFHAILENMEKMKYSPVEISRAISLGYQRSKEERQKELAEIRENAFHHLNKEHENESP